MDRIDADIWNAKDVARLLALVENEKRYYQEVLTLFPVPAAIVGRDLTLLSVNREFRKRFLPHPDEDRQQRLTDVLHATVIREHIVPAFERGIAAHDAGITVVDESGTANSWMLDAVPLPDVHKDAPSESLVVLRSVAEKESGLSAILMDAGTVIWKVDPASGDLEFGNEAASRVLGYANPEQWINRVHPEDEKRVAWVYEAVLESGRGATVEYRLQRPGAPSSDEGRWAADQLLPVKQPGGKIGILNVITTLQGERRHHMDEMVQSREMATAMRLSRQVAHEFNNLWMIVSGYAEVLEGMPDLDVEARSSLEEITKAAHRGMDTTRQLLEFGRPPAAEIQTFDLHQALREWQLDADLHLPPGKAPVTASAERLETALHKLFEFVQKRSEGARIVVETRRDTRISDYGGNTARGQFVVLRIGPLTRFSQATIDHWSEPYFAELERVVPIGLATVYSQLRQTGVTARLQQDEPGKAAFLLYLPLGKLPEPPKPKQSQYGPGAESGTPASTRESVLVVDEDESIRSLVGRILEREGYRVLIAGGGDDALALVRSEGVSPDILITDLLLDGMSGQDIAARLRESAPAMRVLYISGSADDPELIAGNLPSGQGFLQKPFTIAALATMVRTVLDDPKS